MGLTPLLPSLPQLQPNNSVTLEHTITLASDPYLDDHRLDGKPVLPAAVALEWMAEFVQSAWPEWIVTQVRELRVLRGIVLETEAGRKILFRGTASSQHDSESLQVAVEILDSDRLIPFYRAFVILQRQIDPVPTSQTLPLSSGIQLHPAVAYRDYLFHGQRFQLVTAIDRLNETGIDARVMPSQPTAWLSKDSQAGGTTNYPLPHEPHPSWIFDPGLIDVAPQLAIVWSRSQTGTTALPVRFGRVARFGQSMLQGSLQIALRVNQVDDHILTYDAVFTDGNKNVCLHLQDIESTCNTALNRLSQL